MLPLFRVRRQLCEVGVSRSGSYWQGSNSDRPIARGGTKVDDLRRLQINNADEERQVFAAVDPEALTGDYVVSLWGARGIALADLIAEGKQMSKDMIDQDALEVLRQALIRPLLR